MTKMHVTIEQFLERYMSTSLVCFQESNCLESGTEAHCVPREGEAVPCCCIVMHGGCSPFLLFVSPVYRPLRDWQMNMLPWGLHLFEYLLLMADLNIVRLWCKINAWWLWVMLAVCDLEPSTVRDTVGPRNEDPAEPWHSRRLGRKWPSWPPEVTGSSLRWTSLSGACVWGYPS